MENLENIEILNLGFLPFTNLEDIKFLEFGFLSSIFNMGIINFSLLSFFKYFVLFLLILLNLGLLYVEYLDNKNNKKLDYMIQSAAWPINSRNILVTLSSAASAYQTYLTINSEHIDTNKQQQLETELFNSIEKYKEIRDNNLLQNLNIEAQINRISLNTSELNNIKNLKSDITKQIKINEDKNLPDDNSVSNEILTLKSHILNLELEESRVLKALTESTNGLIKFSEKDGIDHIEGNNVNPFSLPPQCDGRGIQNVNLNNNDGEALEIKKSMIINLDELLDKFDNFDGITKLAFTMVLNSSVMLSIIFTLISNIYGNYLIEKFNLEKKYPKIAFLINYRKKVSKYVIYTKFILMIFLCLINLTLGLSILSLKI
jgi:hypothetical protein